MKNQKGFIPVIIILVVLIGFVGVYFLGTLKPKDSNIDPASKPTVSVLPSSVATSRSATLDPTANWKTYTNTKHKFEVKQPKDALVGYFDARSGLFNDPNGEENQIDILLESQTELFKKFIQIEVTDSVMYKKTLFEATSDVYTQQKEHFQTTKISQMNPVKFLGFEGYEYTFSGQAMRALNWGGVVEKGDYKVKIFEKDGFYFSFYSRIDATLDQILSTFKFTN